MLMLAPRKLEDEGRHIMRADEECIHAITIPPPSVWFDRCWESIFFYPPPPPHPQQDPRQVHLECSDLCSHFKAS